jgi:hypothetical protein
MFHEEISPKIAVSENLKYSVSIKNERLFEIPY